MKKTYPKVWGALILAGSKMLIFSLLMLYGQLVFGNSLSELEKLVADKRYTQAWQLARQIAPENEGTPAFDYLYGLSALETGHYDYAVFALERVVVQQTTAIRPRLELARAYMQMQNNSAALREFRAVLALNPPTQVRANVHHFMAKISQHQEIAPRSEMTTRVFSAIGHDSNANFGADTALLTTPLLGAVVLNNLSVRQASPFALLQGQLNYRYDVSDKLSWFAGTGLGRKQYKKADDFDLDQFAFNGGMMVSTEAGQYKLAIKKRALWLNGEKYKSASALEASIARHVGDAGILSGTLSYDDQQFMQNNDRDGRDITATVNYVYKQGAVQQQLQGALSWGKADQQGSQHHAKDTMGLRYTLERSWSDKQSSSASLHYQHLNHLGNDPVYAEKRRDKRISLSLQHAIKINRQTALFFEAGVIDNQSNLSLYETDKSYIQAGLGYSF